MVRLVPLGEVEELFEFCLAKANVVAERSGLVDFESAFACVGVVTRDPVGGSVRRELSLR